MEELYWQRRLKIKWKNISEIPNNAIIGTSSIRRKAFLLAFNPSYNITILRGNINTRIEKLSKGKFDAIILAEAGIKRMGIKINYFKIPETILPPSAGQGAIAVQCLKNNNNLKHILQLLNDEKSFLETLCERKFIEKLNGNCGSPISASAIINKDKIKLTVAVAKQDGSIIIKDTISGFYKNAGSVGTTLGLRILSKVQKYGSFL